jgi:hypothetical protein
MAAHYYPGKYIKLMESYLQKIPDAIQESRDTLFFNWQINDKEENSAMHFLSLYVNFYSRVTICNQGI